VKERRLRKVVRHGKPVRWSVGLSGLLDRSNHTGLGGQVVWSGISVRIPDQTAHLDRTYDSISITTDDIDAITTNPEGHPRTSEPKGLSWPPQLRRKGVEGGAGATRGRFPLYCGPARRYARPRPPLPRPVPPPRSNWLGPRTRATRVAPTVQSWRSTVMLSYSRTEGFGGSDGRRLRGRVGRALEGFRGQRRLPGPFGSDRPLARVQEGHSRNIERWFSDQLHQGFRTSGGVALLVRWGKAE